MRSMRGLLVSAVLLVGCDAVPAAGVADASSHDGPPAVDAPPPDARLCTGDGDCTPMNQCGAFGECLDPAGDPCISTGEHSRTCTDFHCGAGGTCEGTDRMETEGCTRDTEGVTCGADDCVDGPCEFLGDPTCGEVGSFQRICTPRVCGGEVCGDGTPTVTDVGCTRDTEGVMCAPDTCSDGPCAFEGDATCDDTGLLDRTCTPHACMSGACTDGSTFTTPVSCTRVTAGVVCGMTTCSDGPCGFEGNPTCDETGTLVRSCGTPICAMGGCTGSSPSSMVIACMRETGGTTCSPTTCVDTSACMFEGQPDCDETGTKTQSCTPHICGGDTCNAGAATTMTVTCTRVTDGDLCGITAVGCPIGLFRDLCCNTSGACNVTCSPCS